MISCQDTPTQSEQELLVVLPQASMMYSVIEWCATLPNNKLMNDKNNLNAIIARLRSTNVNLIDPESRFSPSKLLWSYHAWLAALVLHVSPHLSPI